MATARQPPLRERRPRCVHSSTWKVASALFYAPSFNVPTKSNQLARFGYIHLFLVPNIYFYLLYFTIFYENASLINPEHSWASPDAIDVAFPRTTEELLHHVVRNDEASGEVPVDIAFAIWLRRVVIVSCKTPTGLWRTTLITIIGIWFLLVTIKLKCLIFQWNAVQPRRHL